MSSLVANCLYGMNLFDTISKHCRTTRLSPSTSAWIPNPRCSKEGAEAHRKERPAALGITLLSKDVTIHSAHIICPCASGASVPDGSCQDAAGIRVAKQISAWSRYYFLRGAKKGCTGDAVLPPVR